MSDENKDQFFRANIGVIVLNGEGKVLALQRDGIPGAWQFPQGGLDQGETVREGGERELKEETSIVAATALNFLAEYPEWLYYTLPEEMQRRHAGLGQIQKWLLYQVKDETTFSFDLSEAEHHEFDDWQWMDMEDLVKIVIDFRKLTYIKLLYWLRERDLKNVDQ